MAIQTASYSFLDVFCTFTGPTGFVNLGDGSGASEEGIVIAMAEDKASLVVGADGSTMYSLHAGKHGNVTVNLLKTSPQNQLLSAIYAAQTVTSTLTGNNVIVITNKNTQEVITCRAVAFQKLPDITNAKEAGVNSWTFLAGFIDMSLAGSLV